MIIIKNVKFTQKMSKFQFELIFYHLKLKCGQYLTIKTCYF